jgi:hypothetical protein
VEDSLCRGSSVVVAKRAFRQGVEFPTDYVSLKLLVPGVRVELCEPLAECR